MALTRRPGAPRVQRSRRSGDAAAGRARRPQRADKSTFYDAFLADSTLPFLNADLFAAETGVDSLEAARILDATRDRMVEDRLGFITETVFSDPYGQKLAMLRKATDAGYEVTLIYIGIASADLSSRRIDQGLALGGHDVPRGRIAPRFKRSLANLREAVSFVTSAQPFDNSLVEAPFQHVATFKAGALEWRTKRALPRWCRGIGPSSKG